jgi:hypothetical protein
LLNRQRDGKHGALTLEAISAYQMRGVDECVPAVSPTSDSWPDNAGAALLLFGF